MSRCNRIRAKKHLRNKISGFYTEHTHTNNSHMPSIVSCSFRNGNILVILVENVIFLSAARFFVLQEPEKKYKHLEYTIQEKGKRNCIKGKESMKILGVWLDENITWNKQISSMKGKAFNNARNLCRINHLLPMKTKILLYNSYVASQLSYADIIWGGCSDGNKKKLQLVQNFSLKTMTGKTSATEARKSLKFLNLEEKRNIHYGAYGYKLANGLAPINQTTQFNKLKATSSRLLKNGTMKPPIHKTQQYTMSTLFKTITTWNQIPAEIKASESLPSFKTKLQNNSCKTH